MEILQATLGVCIRNRPLRGVLGILSGTLVTGRGDGEAERTHFAV